MSKIRASTQFINVMVKVKAGTTAGTYDVHTAPKVPLVTQCDTVINYQLYDDDNQGIYFTGLDVTPIGNNQLSPASLSISRKQLTLTDANTESITLNVNLLFSDGKSTFSHDPQIRNEPD